MGKETGIAWADSTMNPWVGCTKVSPACDSCYAESFDARFGGAHWGKDAPRRFFGDKHWNEPMRWNRAVERGAVSKSGRYWCVFCASLCDVLEKRDDLAPHRERLWDVIRRTPALTWLLLTKRPQEIPRLVPDDMRSHPRVWWGTTIESDDYLFRAEALIKHVPDAPVRFLSMEPLLSDVPIADVLQYDGRIGINWVIQGGESGAVTRPLNAAWLRKARQACQDAGVPYFLKQADEGTDGITATPPAGKPSPIANAAYRKRDLRLGADGMKRVQWIVERPYLDGEQSVEWPA